MSFSGFLFYLVVFLVIRYFLLKQLRKHFATFPKCGVPDAEPVFPADFRFGVSTSAYQVEANVPPSNWMLWERQTDRYGNPKAPVEPMKCDGFNRFMEDAEHAHKMGCKFYRLSFCWSRLNPRPGQFDEEALAVYRGWLIKLREMGIEPLLVLWHFEHPAWLEERGSFTGGEFVQRYKEYVEFVLRGVHDLCNYYHTVNEPIGFVVGSVIADIHPPGKGSWTDAIEGLANMMRCHAIAYKMIHRMNPAAKVSYAHAVVPFVPKHEWSLLESIIAWAMNYSNRAAFSVFQTGKLQLLWMSREIPDIKGALDFISLNHYYVGFVTFNWKEWARINNSHQRLALLSYGATFLPSNDMGWGMMPSSLAGVTKWIHNEFNKGKMDVPIMITEHGVASTDDSRRQWFLKDSLWHLSMLLHENIPVTAYMHWSLTDNYEWAEGSKQKFGLVAVNYQTMERTAKKSAEVYAGIISGASTS